MYSDEHCSQMNVAEKHKQGILNRGCDVEGWAKIKMVQFKL